MGKPTDPGPLRGNRLWLVPTERGTVIQKFYGERYGLLRRTLAWIVRKKTACRPRGRRETERRMLALWSACGFAVPRDLSEELPWLSSDRVLVMEFVMAPVLGNVLRERIYDREERSGLLTRFAAEWGRRHRAALDRGEAGLVQEHATFDHVLVDGDRFVIIDLEQAFRPRKDLMPIVAKEVAGYLRTAWSRTSPETFAADLAAIVRGYPDRSVLAAAAAEYLRNPRRGRRILWRLERIFKGPGGRGRRKYAPLKALAEALRKLDGPTVARADEGQVLPATATESRVMAALLAGDHPVLAVLRAQYEAARVVKREETGAGFFADFEVSAAAPRLPDGASLEISDVYADLDGLKLPAGFVLFVRDGALRTLECFSAEDAPWSGDRAVRRVFYVKHRAPGDASLVETKVRDLAWELRKTRS